MKVLKMIGKGLLLVVAAICVILLVSIAVNYRPGAVVGQRVDPGSMESLEGSSVHLSNYAGSVILLSFAASW